MKTILAFLAITVLLTADLAFGGSGNFGAQMEAKTTIFTNQSSNVTPANATPIDARGWPNRTISFVGPGGRTGFANASTACTIWGSTDYNGVTGNWTFVVTKTLNTSSTYADIPSAWQWIKVSNAITGGVPNARTSVNATLYQNTYR